MKSTYVEAPGKRRCNCRQQVVTKQLGPGMFQQYTTNKCDECPNMKLAKEDEIFSFTVEPGMVDGHETEYFEEGEPHIDGEPGDLKVSVGVGAGRGGVGWVWVWA